MVSRAAYFSAALSVICGVMVFFLFRHYTPRESHLTGEGYAILAICDSEDDRYIREALEQGGIKDVISESSLTVPMDDFGSLREVPLDIFHAEIKYFDPRDTGYAAKLRSFFVHDGKRFFFIPLEGAAGLRTTGIRSQLGAILGDIPFSFSAHGQEKPFFLYFALLASASAFTLFFSRSRRHFLYLLPVLLAMGWGGFSTAILAALLCGIWEFLREPIEELSAARRYKRGAFDYAGSGFRGIMERLKPFRINLLLALLFLYFILALCITSELSSVPMLAACFFFFFLNFISFQCEKERVRNSLHIPFTPVLLFPVKSKTFFLYPFLLPFAAASLLAISLPRIFPELSPARENAALMDTRHFVAADDYYRHVAFQRSFSFRSLNQTQDASNPFNLEGYLRYYLGDDGLISSTSDNAHSLVEAPPFPLEKLKEFLLSYDNLAVAQPESNFTNKTEWISLLIIFAACIIDMVRPRILPKKRIPVFRDKRIAA